MSFTYQYPHLAVAVDAVVFGVDLADPSSPELRVLLVERADRPYRGMLALPGGFVGASEDLDDAVERVLREETGVGSRFYTEQLRAFGAPDRDPRERVVTVAYLALVNVADCKLQAGSGARGAGWYSARLSAELAFDHRSILSAAIERLEAKVRYAPIGFDLLPEKFSLSDLQHLYEAILNRPLDKRNFRRRIGEMGILRPTGEMKATTGRNAQLFSFDKAAYDRAVERGFNFEV